LREGAARGEKNQTKAPASPLAGKLFDENGKPLSVQGAAKGKRRYRYYVSRALVRGVADRTERGWRIPATELERAVIGAAKAFLDDRHAVLTALQESGIDNPDVMEVFKFASDLSGRLANETEGAATLTEITEKVQLSAGGIRIRLRISLPTLSDRATPKILRITRFVSMQMRRCGVELKLVLDGNQEMPRKADPVLLKAVARARRWFEEIASGRVRSSAEIARREALPKGYVAGLLRLAFLSPSIIETVIEAHGLERLNLQTLINKRVALPLNWRDQKEWLHGVAARRTC